MERLIKSLQNFPEMLDIREIVCDEDMVVLGGNMRLRALREAGAKECNAKIVTGLTDEQKREFAIKDNAGFGQWNMDDLANGWDNLPLVDWGVPVEFTELIGIEEEKLKQEEQKLQPYKKVHILISIDISASDAVVDILDQLRKIEGVEIEQAAN